MKTIEAKKASREACRPYGVFTRLTDYECFAGDGWECWMTEDLCMNQAARLEMCHSDAAVPYVLAAMGKSETSQKLFVCGSGKMVLAVAAKTAENPQADQVEAFIIESGEIFVLDPGVWHDFAKGVESETDYYVLTGEEDNPENFLSLINGPVQIEIDK